MPEQIGGAQVYTVKEVAKILDRSTVMVSNLIRAEKLEAIHLGGQYVIVHDRLVDYLKEIKLPESIIEYRLEIRSPQNGAIINKKNPVA